MAQNHRPSWYPIFCKCLSFNELHKIILPPLTGPLPAVYRVTGARDPIQATAHDLILDISNHWHTATDSVSLSKEGWMKVDRTNGLIVSSDPGGESQLSVFASKDGGILLSVKAHGQDEIFVLNDNMKVMSFRLGIMLSERFGIDVSSEADTLIEEYYKQLGVDYASVVAHVDHVMPEYKVVVDGVEGTTSLACDADDCRGLAEYICKELNSTYYTLITISKVGV
jgi:hypothetical protein